MIKRKKKEEELDKVCHCSDGEECICGDSCECGDNCTCNDECCCEETASEVKKHLEECDDCKSVYRDMCLDSYGKVTAKTNPLNFSRVNDFNAGILQSVLLFVSFLVITIGVFFEARTPYDYNNGLYAFTLVIPATGFMLLLVNWYFVRFYKSRKIFSWFSCGITAGITILCFLWAIFHYEAPQIIAWLFINPFVAAQCWLGILLFAVCLILSKLFSNRYAKMLGKE
jgi:hypothetical protein